jgi:N-acetyl-gamma-glutamyl-phosphate/LysW-gamma-L-alpha-aminoadipyl-6-phosphate reductase
VIAAAILGGSGYIGGELLRLLVGHPEVEVRAVSSATYAGKRVDGLHPNLRGRTDLRFCHPDELPDADVLFLAAGHRNTMSILPRHLDSAALVLDLSGDFRLESAERYERYYGQAHAHPELLRTFVSGFPELRRRELRQATRIAVPGCIANASTLTLAPLAAAGLIGPEEVIEVDARSGSSGSGSAAGQANLHAERSGVLRIFSTEGHRHEAEILDALGVEARITATAVESVRGVQVICRLPNHQGLSESDVRRLYTRRYRDEPFVRVVAHRRGNYRLPEPKLLTGSNYCDVGFAVRADDGRILAVGAVDNLVKGGAGNAVQCLNIRMNWPETAGLEFTGLHPI